VIFKVVLYWISPHGSLKKDSWKISWISAYKALLIYHTFDDVINIMVLNSPKIMKRFGNTRVLG
jgi:hypothetical protein